NFAAADSYSLSSSARSLVASRSNSSSSVRAALVAADATPSSQFAAATTLGASRSARRTELAGTTAPLGSSALSNQARHDYFAMSGADGSEFHHRAAASDQTNDDAACSADATDAAWESLADAWEDSAVSALT